MDECKHTYYYKYFDIVARTSVFSKKKCSKCGEMIIIDAKGRIAITAFIAASCAVLVLFVKHGAGLIGVQEFGGEIKFITFFAFLSMLMVGLKFILNKVTYIPYKKD